MSNIEEFQSLTDNLRTQLVIFDIGSYIHKNKLLYSTIKKKLYYLLRIIKPIFLYLYSFMPFFEIPFHCYKKTTFKLTSDYENPRKYCKELELQLIFNSTDYYLNETIYRFLEIFFLTSFLVIQIIFIHEKKTLNSLTKSYERIEFILFACIILSFLDICFGLLFNYYPLINFFLRGIIIILLNRGLRLIWKNIGIILYQTRRVSFLIFYVMVIFGVLGYFLFGDYSEEFNSVSESIYSLFILLSTCNFPDVMLNTFTNENKRNFFFFFAYICINYFILFTLLKTLYYSEFFEEFRSRARIFVEDIMQLYEYNDKDDIKQVKSLNIFKSKGNKSFELLLIDINNKFSLTDDEYEKILKLVKYERVSNLDNSNDSDNFDLEEILSKKYSEIAKNYKNKIDNNKVLKFLSNKFVEIVVCSINIIIIIIFFNSDLDKISVFIIQFIWCLIFNMEFFIYVYNLGIKTMFLRESIHSTYFIINFLTTICCLFIIIFNQKINDFNTIRYIVGILFIARLVRVLKLLGKFSEIRSIFKTLHNMKNLFSNLISTLFSFYYLFVTISMYFTGGKIKKNSFDDINEIPDLYVNINFNDFGSGFLSCFCLTMINNINIIAKSLSFGLSNNYRIYFAFFYFLSTLIILNICSTLLLEMYMTVKANLK